MFLCKVSFRIRCVCVAPSIFQLFTPLVENWFIFGPSSLRCTVSVFIYSGGVTRSRGSNQRTFAFSTFGPKFTIQAMWCNVNVLFNVMCFSKFPWLNSRYRCTVIQIMVSGAAPYLYWYQTSFQDRVFFNECFASTSSEFAAMVSLPVSILSWVIQSRGAEIYNARVW